MQKNQQWQHSIQIKLLIEFAGELNSSSEIFHTSVINAVATINVLKFNILFKSYRTDRLSDRSHVVIN